MNGGHGAGLFADRAFAHPTIPATAALTSRQTLRGGNTMLHLRATLAGALSLCATAAAAEPRDAFFFVSEMNKASTVMVTATGIVDRALGRTIAQSVAKVIADGARPGAERSADYLRIETALIAAGGPDVP